MNSHPHRALVAFVGLLCFVSITSAQNKQKKCSPTTTNGKNVVGLLKINAHETVKVRGVAVYQITALHVDNTLGGILTYALAEAERQHLAQMLNKPLSAIPARLEIPNVVADFVKHTDCPVLRLEVPPLSLKLADTELQLNRIVLSRKAGEDDLSIMLCVIARQANSGLYSRVNFAARAMRFKEILSCQ